MGQVQGGLGHFTRDARGTRRLAHRIGELGAGVREAERRVGGRERTRRRRRAFLHHRGDGRRELPGSGRRPCGSGRHRPGPPRAGDFHGSRPRRRRPDRQRRDPDLGTRQAAHGRPRSRLSRSRPRRHEPPGYGRSRAGRPRAGTFGHAGAAAAAAAGPCPELHPELGPGEFERAHGDASVTRPTAPRRCAACEAGAAPRGVPGQAPPRRAPRTQAPRPPCAGRDAPRKPPDRVPLPVRPPRAGTCGQARRAHCARLARTDHGAARHQECPGGRRRVDRGRGRARAGRAGRAHIGGDGDRPPAAGGIPPRPQPLVCSSSCSISCSFSCSDAREARASRRPASSSTAARSAPRRGRRPAQARCATGRLAQSARRCR